MKAVGTALMALGGLFLAAAVAGFGLGIFSDGSNTGQAIVAGVSIWAGGLGLVLLLAGSAARWFGRR